VVFGWIPSVISMVSGSAIASVPPGRHHWCLIYTGN
jgi:hypothetical protein